MQEYGLILTLAMAFSLALALGFATQKLKLSPILGYLIAGVVVSPFTPGPVANAQMADQLAQVGVVLLMFGVGLRFHLRDLWAVRGVALPGAICQSLAATALGILASRALGLDLAQAIVLGLSVSIASTVVFIRVLADNGLLDGERGRIAVGWLIVEDIYSVLALVLLPSMAEALGPGGGARAGAILLAVGAALLKIGALVALVLFGGGKLIPWVLAKVARTRSRELFTLAVLAFALAIAAMAAYAFGASMALGAFLAGMVVGQSKMSEQAASDALPLKDAFAVLFFVSVGMLFDPALVLANLPLFLAVLGIVLVAKPLGALLAVTALGRSAGTALTVAGGIAQIGEFSFILSSEARRLGILSAEGATIIVAASLVTIGINPLVFKASARIERSLRGMPRLWAALNRRSEARGRALNAAAAFALGADGPAKVRAVVVGYGPVGRTATRLLESFGIESVVVDLNVDSVAAVAQAGSPAIYGDAGKADILKAAGIETARYLIVTLPDLASRIPVITSARRLNGSIKVFSRARYLTERSILEGLGVSEACYEEAESAVGLSELLLRSEGADEARIEETMTRLREEFALTR